MTEHRCILVVDDDEDLRDLLAITLSSDEISVECAENGLEALQALEHLHPDVILLDMKMPVMDGWEFCRRLEGREHPPIVVLTAASDPAERAREVNADAWLGKPFESAELRAIVNRFVRSRA